MFTTCACLPYTARKRALPYLPRSEGLHHALQI